jgi:hypothetical protein
VVREFRLANGQQLRRRVYAGNPETPLYEVLSYWKTRTTPNVQYGSLSRQQRLKAIKPMLFNDLAAFLGLYPSIGMALIDANNQVGFRRYWQRMSR